MPQGKQSDIRKTQILTLWKGYKLESSPSTQNEIWNENVCSIDITIKLNFFREENNPKALPESNVKTTKQSDLLFRVKIFESWKKSQWKRVLSKRSSAPWGILFSILPSIKLFGFCNADPKCLSKAIDVIK